MKIVVETRITVIASANTLPAHLPHELRFSRQHTAGDNPRFFWPSVNEAVTLAGDAVRMGLPGD